MTSEGRLIRIRSFFNGKFNPAATYSKVLRRDEYVVDAAMIQAIFGLTRWAVYRRLRAGSFPEPIRVGGRRLWIAAQLDEWWIRKLREQHPRSRWINKN